MKILEAEMLTAAAQASQFPEPDLPEVAFLGRSNVGKSSLLNKLVQRRKLARTSSTPGKTRLIHWYRVRRPDDELCFVDLPGYGYAMVSKTERRAWADLMDRYFDQAAGRGMVVQIVDSKVGATDLDHQAYDYLLSVGVYLVVVATKTDRLSRNKAAQAVARIRADLGG